MAQQSVTLKAKGLYTQANQLSLPEGALSEADNVIIDRDNVIEPRRGFKLYGNSFGTSSNTAKQLLLYKDRLIRHYATTLQYDNGSGTFTSFTGSYSEPSSGLRIKSQESNGNLYFTTSNGIKKISESSAANITATSITSSGGIKALDIDLALNATTGWLLNTYTVSYRVVWGIEDNSKNLILGTPSPATQITNDAGASRSVDITITIPQEVTTAHFYQIYRTSYNANPETGDEQKLVYENNPTSAEITAKVLTVNDPLPEALNGGANLYTNPSSGEGINQANEPPPLAKDITLFKNSLFYANTQTKYKKIVTLIGTADLIASTSTFTITGAVTNTFTFKATENYTAGATDVELFSSGVPSQDINATARSLVRVVNRSSGSTLVYAYYISGPDDLPGAILFEARALNQVAFSFTVNSTITGEAFNPILLTSGTTIIADNEIAANRLYYSKLQQPEAVPALNYFDVGPKDKAIKRIIALRDSVFVLKEEAVYRVSGEFGSFIVTSFDSSTLINAPDSASVLNNQIYMLTDQGVATISDTGISIISRPIENLVLKLDLTAYTNYSTASFGVAYESDRSYYLWTVENTTDTTATQCFRFNVFTSGWTRWPINKTCGIVNTLDNRLYLGAGDTNYVEQERKDFSRTDYADREIASSIQANFLNDATLNLPSTTIAQLAARDVIVQIQYLTIYQFNKLVKKLDLDSGVFDSDYESLLTASPGNNLRTLLTSLAQKLDSDTGVTDSDYEATITAYTSSFVDSQAAYNDIVGKLNLDATVVYTNYSQSTNTTTYESIISALDEDNNIITFPYTYPFIEGAVTFYKRIESSVVWAPQFFGDPSTVKHMSESTIIFERNNFSEATISYSSDLTPGFTPISFTAAGNGTFGNSVFGNGQFGGLGNQVPFRTYIPRNNQRCRYLNCKFEHSTARESYALFGVSITGSPISVRGYK